MGKRLDFKAQLVADLRHMFDLGQRQLARKGHARGAKLSGGAHARLIVRIHLRGDVQTRLRQRS